MNTARNVTICKLRSTLIVYIQWSCNLEIVKRHAHVYINRWCARQAARIPCWWELISSKQHCPGIAYVACLAPPDMFFHALIFLCTFKSSLRNKGKWVSLYPLDCKKPAVSSGDGVSYLMEARDFLLLRLEKALLTFFLTPLWQGHSNMCMTHGHMNIREKGLGEEPL